MNKLIILLIILNSCFVLGQNVVETKGPDLGQHNKEIYEDLLGYSPDILQNWRKRGII